MTGWEANLLALLLHFVAQAATFRWLTPGTETWEGFSLRAASDWTLGGLILVALGWLTLPRHAGARSHWFKSEGVTAFGRVFLGMATAVIAVALATLAFERVTAAWIVGVTSNVPLPFARAGGATTPGVAHLGTILPAWLVGPAHTYGLEVLHYWSSLHASGFAVFVALFLGALVGWLSSSSRWTLSGIATWLGLILVAAGLFGFTILIVLSSSSLFAWVLAAVLFIVEIFGLLLFLAYQFYTVEYIAGSTRTPVTHSEPGATAPPRYPFVAVQVASYNEPPEVVLRCLESIIALDYPRDRFVVQLLDDSTEAGTVETLGEYCRAHQIDYRHRTNRRGFKGGALNDGLRALPPEVELIAIVDSDYIVDRAFLRATVPAFRSRVVGFVQTPQAYRNAPPGSFARWYALADAYFYRVVQPVRARAQSLIFCGTMGLVARGALEGAGGWSESCVTEDAELSIRLLARGWRGVYLPRTLGWGLAPTSMSATRSQHRRWATGGWQMLRMNQRNLVPFHMSQRQRTDFLMSRVFWIDGLFLLGVAAALATVVVASWFGVFLSVRSLSELALVSAAPVLLLFDGVLKLRVALRSSTDVGYSDVVGVLGFWYAIKINDLSAAIRAAFGARIGFVRTPKTREGRPSRSAAFAGSLRGSWFESMVSLALFGVLGVSVYRYWYLPSVHLSLPSALLLVWLLYYALAFAAAPAFDYYSRTGAAPGEPDERRTVPTREARPAAELATSNPSRVGDLTESGEPGAPPPASSEQRSAPPGRGPSAG
ncbi:MAG: glycosyltransferase [Thermoplasmata archaeon]|nr:glycosyltransferase [Thermoplasmata archaeon]